MAEDLAKNFSEARIENALYFIKIQGSGRKKKKIVVLKKIRI